MESPIKKEESYVERRQLFKNIWDTAMNIDGKDGNVISKPKVIKTLRLDEVDRCAAGKKKKQRIKNLRIVCNKLLDFCDRQDADDMFYEKMAAKGRESPNFKDEDHKDPKKSKTSNNKRKAKKAKSMFIPIQNGSHTQATSPDRRGETFTNSKSARNASPNKVKRTSFVYKPLLTNKSLKTLNNINENSRRREKRNGVYMFPGMKALQGTKSTCSYTKI